MIRIPEYSERRAAQSAESDATAVATPV
jgi:hypothetical protein